MKKQEKEYIFIQVGLLIPWCLKLAYTQKMHPFDHAKRKISESSQRLSQLFIWFVVLLIATVIIVTVVFTVVLGFDITVIDLNDLYDLVEVILTAGVVAIALLAISGIALLVIYIMIYVQFYHIGSGFNILSEADRSVINSKNASYVTFGYLIAVVLGIVFPFFAPDWVGTILTILGYVSLAFGFYFVYRTFIEFRNQNRFGKEPTKFLLAAVIVNIISNIVVFFFELGSFGIIIGYILLLLGLRDLSREITQVYPPSPAPVPSSVTVEAPVAQPPPAPAKEADVDFIPKAEISDSPKAKFCTHCGAKIGENTKFCTNCGANV